MNSEDEIFFIFLIIMNVSNIDSWAAFQICLSNPHLPLPLEVAFHSSHRANPDKVLIGARCRHAIVKVASRRHHKVLSMLASVFEGIDRCVDPQLVLGDVQAARRALARH